MTGSALKALVSFFTMFHLDIDQDDMDAMERKFHLVPVVGLIFGFIIILELAILALVRVNFGGIDTFLCTAIVLATVYLGSKFLHFDGLTDFGDGMVASGDQEKHLRALKDTLIGAGGVGVALIVTLISVASYQSLPFVEFVIAIPAIEVMVKNAQVSAAAYGIAGKGMAGRQVECTTPVSMVKSIVLSLICGAILVSASWGVLYIIAGASQQVLLMGFAVMAIELIVSVITGLLMGRCANRNFGMVNGDILGATNEISRASMALVLAIVLPIILAVI